VPCRQQMPHFEHAYQTAGPDLAVIGIDVGFNDSIEAVRAYRKKLGITMQVAGSPAVTLRRGETFYENPTDVHLVSANASKTAPAKILVFIVKNKGAPVSRGVPRKEIS